MRGVWMKAIYITLILFAVMLVSCKAPELRRDPAESPADPRIDQFRLELHGCLGGVRVGTTICKAGEKARAVTEYPGKLVITSSGETSGCSIRRDIQIPEGQRYTTIPTPDRDSKTRSCETLIIYQPSYPNSPSTVPTRVLLGSVFTVYDQMGTPYGSVAQPTYQKVRISLPSKIVRGAYINRALKDPVSFTGKDISFTPTSQGTDLILIKGFDANNTPYTYVVSGNYYSPKAERLTFEWGVQSSRPVVRFPETVSVVTIEGAEYRITYDTYVKLDAGFTGYVRAYTAQGRTAVLYFNKGDLSWNK